MGNCFDNKMSDSERIPEMSPKSNSSLKSSKSFTRSKSLSIPREKSVFTIGDSENFTYSSDNSEYMGYDEDSVL